MAIASPQIKESKLAFIGNPQFGALTIIPYEAVSHCVSDSYPNRGFVEVFIEGKQSVVLHEMEAQRFSEGYFNYIKNIEETKAVDEKFYDLIKGDDQYRDAPLKTPRKRGN